MTEPTVEALPEPLRAALERRGYTTLTAVQTAVLDEAQGGHDLRISSQTGSGKTVALGFVVSEVLLGDPGAGSGPVVLVIVPTRELAAQVGEELGWLFADVEGFTLDVVTGGTSVRGERERLVRPPRVLVGTPGRLLDHLQAGALDLTGVRELVLDEADQMLDLGFRDELEALLGSMPEERRTHLVSATFAEGVRRLADRFQRDARHVEGTALGEANADIEHIAVRVAPSDRYAALVNLLLIEPTERTLVFVATRAGAAQLADRLAEDGFAALPLSGDLAQAQRTRTLAAFKAGVVQILVATDVAARGLDLPDVARVVHTSPAMDGEAFTHRSGRTGRAGRQGQSLLLVTPRQERKVRFQLRDAGVDAEWRSAPEPDEVRAALRARERAAILERLTSEEPLDEERLTQARELLADHEAERVVATLLERDAARSGPRPLALGAASDELPRARQSVDLDRPARPIRPRDAVEGVRFQINWGFHGGANPKRILAHVCRRGGVDGAAVGAIRLFPRSTTFEIAPEHADEFEARVAAPDERDPHLRIRRWLEGGAPDHEGGGRDERADRDPRSGDGGRPWRDRGELREGHRPWRPRAERGGPGPDRRDDRGPRRYDDRGPRDRGPGGFGRRDDDQGPRRYESRGPRQYDDRGPRQYGDRGPGQYGDRGPRQYGDRGPQQYGDRGPRQYGDRGPQQYGDRGPRQYGDRGPRGHDDRGPRRPDDRGAPRDDRRGPARDRYDGGRDEASGSDGRSAFERRQGHVRRPFLDHGGDRARRFGGGRGDRR